MTKEEHLSWLAELEKNCGSGSLVFPQRDGAFYFGRYITYGEYVDKYREQCKKEGWL